MSLIDWTEQPIGGGLSGEIGSGGRVLLVEQPYLRGLGDEALLAAEGLLAA